MKKESLVQPRVRLTRMLIGTRMPLTDSKGGDIACSKNSKNSSCAVT